MVGGNVDISCIVKLEDIELVVLKNMKVYSMLSDDVKDKLEKHIHIVRDDVGDRMAKAREARKERKSKYENIPEELTCKACLKTVEAVPSSIAAYCNRKGILLADYLKDFKCIKCKDLEKPARVEKIKLACKCGYEVIYAASVVDKYASNNNLTREEYVASYVCRKCKGVSRREAKETKEIKEVKEVNESMTTTTTTLPEPTTTTTTTTRGRKPKEEFIGLPRVMKCIVCEKEVASNLAYLKVKAEKLGTTIEGLIKGYKCNVCKKL